MIDLEIHTQPDDESCGPTSLHAIYQYYGFELSLQDIVKSMERSHSGGTFASILGKHALMNGFQVIMYVNNLKVFDPTWFSHNEGDPELLINKLSAQMKHKHSKDLQLASRYYLEYIELGGQVRFETLSVTLLKSYFAMGIPILTGLSATYLYRSAREHFTRDGRSIYDDVLGTPCGHFVVLLGYDDRKRLVVVADPHRENPLSKDNYYKVSSQRLINAIMLGVLTYDSNLLIIQPKGFECKPLL